ncbi:MAG: hypothetical protein IK015_10020 [Treponema sp.]|nr:hypothetical protein [Treponema sp.]
MKAKLLFFITAIFFFAVAPNALFAAQTQELPKKVFELSNEIFETAQSDDGNWLFVNAASASDGKNRLYSFDKKTGEARVLFEPFPDTQFRFVYGMHFWPKTQKLYFMVHNGECIVNGTRNIFLHEGLYTAQKDQDTNYSALGVWRQSALET